MTTVALDDRKVIARICCLASAKGGSGKTVIALSIAYILASLGKRALVVDCDASTNGATIFSLPALSKHKSLEQNDAGHGLFEYASNWTPSLITLSDGCFLLPSTYTMSQTEDTTLDTMRSNLESVLEQYDKEFDFIILDAQAGTDRFSEIAVDKAHIVVIVSEYDPVSVKGVERLKAIFSKALFDKEVYVLFNKVLPDIAESFSDHLVIAKYL